MKTNKISEAPLMGTYSRCPVTFVSGEGCRLFDADGREYLDCLSGIAVVAAGHGNKEVAEAISTQAEKLVHVSNLFWTEPMQNLAEKLTKTAGGWGKVFFANSGAEAIECAIKLARKWGGKKRKKILCAEGSFHGRTLGALAATGQPKKWAGFEPLPQGFVHLPFNDLQAFESAIDAETAAILIEPIQGENGVIEATPEFLHGLREVCTKKNVLLMLDEIQTGLGRTGSWWAFQQYGIKPDVFTSAKGLANGLPIGACIARATVAEAFSPGDHATTFGGGPVVCAAACATFSCLEKAGVPEIVTEKGEQFKSGLKGLKKVEIVRGKGLMLAAKLSVPIAMEICTEALKKGLILNAVRPDAIRIAPPLTISDNEIDKACSILSEVLGTL